MRKIFAWVSFILLIPTAIIFSVLISEGCPSGWCIGQGLSAALVFFLFLVLTLILGASLFNLKEYKSEKNKYKNYTGFALMVISGLPIVVITLYILIGMLSSLFI